ncbi:MAG: helix-turn-helix domain-containing protein [Ruminococcaceae bacterium]|nr:helix-turn-helix domain-containing protein [Oscillospiraceae bacterium]
MFYQSQHFGVSEYFCKETGKDFSFPMHMHHSFELITVLDGEMTVNIGEQKYLLCRGEAVLIFPEQIHSLSSQKSEHLLVIFSPDIVSAYYSRHSGEYPESNRISLSEYIYSQIVSLEDELSTVKLKAIFYSVCSEFDEGAAYVKRKNAEKGLLREMFEFVENNFDKSCTLEELGTAIGYNSSYLSRYFSESTKMSFVAFVNRYRVSRACHILKNSDKSVMECAYECGYMSLRSFNRNFKLYAGRSPKEYRRTV